jgi:uncharacterized protein (TIGR00251 family)
MLSIQKHPQGAVFKVLVKPRSFKNMITGLHDDALKIKLTAPPVNNAANRMCVKFLAKALDVPKSSLEIVSGHTSHNKLVLLYSDQTDIAEKEYRRLKQRILDLASPLTILIILVGLTKIP